MWDAPQWRTVPWWEFSSVLPWLGDVCPPLLLGKGVLMGESSDGPCSLATSMATAIFSTHRTHPLPKGETPNPAQLLNPTQRPGFLSDGKSSPTGSEVAPRGLVTSELKHKLSVSLLPISSPGLWFLSQVMGLHSSCQAPHSSSVSVRSSGWLSDSPLDSRCLPHFQSSYSGAAWSDGFRRDDSAPDLCPWAEPLSSAPREAARKAVDTHRLTSRRSRGSRARPVGSGRPQFSRHCASISSVNWPTLV